MSTGRLPSTAVSRRPAESTPGCSYATWSSVVGALGVFLVGSVLYRDLFLRLSERWLLDPDASHGMLVLPACGVFAWRGWHQFRSVPRRRVAWRCMRIGVLTIAVGLMLHVLASALSSLLIGTLGLVCVLRGILWITGGRKAIRAYGFAVGCLVFMAPLPPLIRQPVVNTLQEVVSRISSLSLEVLGIPVFQDGIILHLPGLRLEVAEGCSGLRQLMAFVTASVAVAGWFRLSRTAQWLLLIAAVPVAVLSNVFRIFLTGVVYHFLGAEWAQGVFHTVEGLVVVGLGGVIMIWLAASLVRRDITDRVRPM